MARKSNHQRKSDRQRRKAAPKTGRPKFPSRKISDTFMEFAEPLFEDIDDDDIEGPKGQQALDIAFTTWNAVVYADAVGNTRVLEMIESNSKEIGAAGLLVMGMIARKRKMFADDLRLIGKYEFITKRGELILQVEARDPFHSDASV